MILRALAYALLHTCAHEYRTCIHDMTNQTHKNPWVSGCQLQCLCSKYSSLFFTLARVRVGPHRQVTVAPNPNATSNPSRRCAGLWRKAHTLQHAETEDSYKNMQRGARSLLRQGERLMHSSSRRERLHKKNASLRE